MSGEPVEVTVVGASGPGPVINFGTREKPNWGGSAEATGRLHGIQEALAAVQALPDPWDSEASGARDACLDAIRALLPEDAPLILLAAQ